MAVTPDLFFKGLGAVALVVGALAMVAIAVAVWSPKGHLARIAALLTPIPDLVAVTRKLAGVVDENTELSREARDAAKGAAAVSGHVHQVLDRALVKGNGSPSKPGASRAVSGEMAGVALAREAQTSRPDADPPTARGSAAAGRVIE